MDSIQKYTSFKNYMLYRGGSVNAAKQKLFVAIATRVTYSLHDEGQLPTQTISETTIGYKYVHCMVH